MEYITSMEAAKKWNLTKRRVNSLCQEGLIPGAIKDGYRWRIPADFEYHSERKVGNGHIKGFRYVFEEPDYGLYGNVVLNEEPNYTVNKDRGHKDRSDGGILYDVSPSYDNMVLREDGNYYPRRPLPVGVTSFIEAMGGFCYVDKTLMIEEVLKSGVKVSLFTRPRRFGKTTNMDMLRVFFEISDEDTSVYFKDKKIWQCDEETRCQQGKYPVIFISFKDVKCSSWEKAFEGIKGVIADEYRRHDYLLRSETLTELDKAGINNVLSGEADDTQYSRSLKELSRLLKTHHSENAIIIIDEYDTPINEAFHRGYYNELIDFMRVFLAMGLKDNYNLERGFMTGILRVAKEGLFSGLNNLAVYSVLDEKYSQYFGFTAQEVKGILYEYGKSFKMNEVMEWYDGYHIGECEMFNPWSVINYVDNDFKPRPYWTQTSSNTMLGDIMEEATEIIAEQLKALMAGQCAYTTIDTTVIYPELDASVSRVLSFLMMAGYITFEDKELDEEGSDFCKVRIPNKEVMIAYRKEIVNRYCNNISGPTAERVQQALKFKDMTMLQESLEDFLMKSVSFYDTANESFYHGLVLGMVGMFNVYYEVSSNKEMGNGRYDILLRPRHNDRPAYIIELKAATKLGSKESDDEELDNALEEIACGAIKQIKDKEYYVGLTAAGYSDIVLMGMAFNKKKCCIRCEK